MSSVSLDLLTRVGIPLLTILMSGVVTFYLNARLQRRDAVRERLEELYTSVHGFVGLLNGHILTTLSLVQEKIDVNEANQLFIDGADKADAEHFRRIELLVGIYFPSLQSHLADLIRVREELGGLRVSYRRQYGAGDSDGHHLVPAIHAVVKRLDQIEVAFKAAIVREARRVR